MLTDEQGLALAKDVEKVVNIVRSNFVGKIFVFGPAPRHINTCCAQLRHTILDTEGEKVDMIKYTNSVNEFLSKAISFPSNCEFISYKEQFGSEFVAEMLTDGVHLHPTVEPTLSSFIMGLLSRQAAPALPAMANLPTFTSVLVSNGVKALGGEEMEQSTG